MSDMKMTSQHPAISATDVVEDFKKKDLIDAVAETTGMKKSDVKIVTEHVLAKLGDTLAAGTRMNLQPFGKVQVLNSREQPNAQVIRCKVRRHKTGNADPMDRAAE